jgi:hypothetical protein
MYLSTNEKLFAMFKGVVPVMRHRLPIRDTRPPRIILPKLEHHFFQVLKPNYKVIRRNCRPSSDICEYTQANPFRTDIDGLDRKSLCHGSSSCVVVLEAWSCAVVVSPIVPKRSPVMPYISILTSFEQAEMVRIAVGVLANIRGWSAVSTYDLIIWL